jgi:REP element-mobilizing transposase RayT
MTQLQLPTVPAPAPRQRGGRRPGAGRKKTGKKVGGAHHTRDALVGAMHPVHVTLRTRRNVPRLRQRKVYEALRVVLVRYLGRKTFRVVHISIQTNHLHLIVEASNKDALTRGMQSFAINAARAINRVCDRTGKVFEYRYHSRQITTERYAWNAIAYVLNNWRRHTKVAPSQRGPLDPYSSALSFAGWTVEFQVPADYKPLPVSPPRTGLLRSGWTMHGMIPPTHCPGPMN